MLHDHDPRAAKGGSAPLLLGTFTTIHTVRDQTIDLQFGASSNGCVYRQQTPCLPCRTHRYAMHCWLSTSGRCMCRVDWWRPGDRRSCVPLQPAGDWGSGQQWPFRSMVPDAHKNGTIHLYYSGCLGPHGDMYSTLPAEVSHGGHVIFTPACLFCKLLKKCIQVIPGAHERVKLTLPPVANRLRCSPRPKSTTALAAPAPCTAKVEVEARTPGALKIYTPRTNPSSTS